MKKGEELILSFYKELWNFRFDEINIYIGDFGRNLCVKGIRLCSTDSKIDFSKLSELSMEEVDNEPTRNI